MQLNDGNVCVFTAHKRSLRQGNVFSSVCHSVHGDTSTSGRGLHQGGVGQTPPPHLIVRKTVNERAVRILLDCILV